MPWLRLLRRWKAIDALAEKVEAYTSLNEQYKLLSWLSPWIKPAVGGLLAGWYWLTASPTPIALAILVVVLAVLWPLGADRRNRAAIIAQTTDPAALTSSGGSVAAGDGFMLRLAEPRDEVGILRNELRSLHEKIQGLEAFSTSMRESFHADKARIEAQEKALSRLVGLALRAEQRRRLDEPKDELLIINNIFSNDDRARCQEAIMRIHGIAKVLVALFGRVEVLNEVSNVTEIVSREIRGGIISEDDRSWAVMERRREVIQEFIEKLEHESLLDDYQTFEVFFDNR